MSTDRVSKTTISSTTGHPEGAFPSRSNPPGSSGSSGGTMASPGREKGESASGKSRLLNKVTKMASWFATSEPSAQALKQHKKDAFTKAGIPLDDPNGEATVKLHAPVGEIPPDAIKPTSSLSPEEVAKNKTAERLRRKIESHGSGAGSRTSQSSSGISFASASALSPKASFALDDLPFDGSNKGILGNDKS